MRCQAAMRDSVNAISIRTGFSSIATCTTSSSLPVRRPACTASCSITHNHSGICRDARNRAESRFAAQGTQALSEPIRGENAQKNADFSRLLWEFFLYFFWGGNIPAWEEAQGHRIGIGRVSGKKREPAKIRIALPYLQLHGFVFFSRMRHPQSQPSTVSNGRVSEATLGKNAFPTMA